MLVWTNILADLYIAFIEKVAPAFVSRLLFITNGLNVLFPVTTVIIFWKSSHQVPNSFGLLLGNSRNSLLPLILTLITITLNMLSVFSIPVIYHKMYKNLKKSKVDSTKTLESPSLLKQYILPYINHTCWLGSSTILYIIVTWEVDWYKLFTWFLAVILPLNSLISPFLFTHGKIIYKFVTGNVMGQTGLSSSQDTHRIRKPSSAC